MPLSLRSERPEDQAAVRELLVAAFGGRGEAELVDRLRADGDAVVSLVASVGDEIVGHILLSRLSAPFPALGLAPVAVRPDRQGQGIGSRLVRAAIDEAGRGPWRALFVLGAAGWYGRFGFRVDAAAGFSCVYAGPHFMALPVAGDLPTARGPVTYASAFTMLG